MECFNPVHAEPGAGSLPGEEQGEWEVTYPPAGELAEWAGPIHHIGLYWLQELFLDGLHLLSCVFLRELVTEEFFPVSSNLGRKTKFIQQQNTRELVKAFKWPILSTAPCVMAPL